MADEIEIQPVTVSSDAKLAAAERSTRALIDKQTDTGFDNALKSMEDAGQAPPDDDGDVDLGAHLDELDESKLVDDEEGAPAPVGQKPTQAQPPKPPPVAPPQAIDIKTIPEELRPFAESLNKQFEFKANQLQAQLAEIGDLKNHADFHRLVANDPALRNHILEFMQSRVRETEDGGRAPVDRQATPDEPVDIIDRLGAEERSILDAHEARLTAKFQKMMEAHVAPFQQKLITEAARSELTAFRAAHPDFETFVDRQQLAVARAQRPDLSLEEHYFILAGPKLAAARSRQSQDLREQTRRPAAPELRSGARPNLVPTRGMDPSKAFDFARRQYESVVLGRTSGGRR
jgi:hypothetical protein